ncbi:MAG: carcinine hydrolase/isopenicillin-N N-acyltransferase family protein, partial [Muribaculaceae bacterium]
TVAIRMLLDKASTVKEAIELLEGYNMDTSADGKTAPEGATEQGYSNYHFFMADATGDYAIVEYTDADTTKNPTKMEVLTGNDTLRCVTNFYVSPTMAGTKHGIVISEHGKKRYEDLRKGLLGYNYKVTPTQAKDLLKIVAQGPEGSQASTGFTQWSEVFNLSKKTFSVSILREWDKTFEFGIEQYK